MVIHECIGVMGNYDTFYVSLLEMVIVISAFPRKIELAPFTLDRYMYFVLKHQSWKWIGGMGNYDTNWNIFLIMSWHTVFYMYCGSVIHCAFYVI